MQQAATHALNAGVTTVRDLGVRGDLIFRLRDRIAAGAVEGPHILAAGRPLTIPSGHCWFLGGVAEDEAGLLNLVQTEVDRGADVIKIMATGGAMTPSSDPTQPQFAPETLRTAVDLAHSLGRPVAAHAHSRRGIRDAIEAGVETIEHGTFVGEDGARVHDEDLPLFPNSRTVLVATLTPIATRLRVGGIDGGPLARELSAADFWERRRSDTERLFKAGARIIAGSDCGVDNVAHDSVIDEVGYLAQAGLSPAQALAAATSQAANVFGIGSNVGRLAEGQRADLLVVAGDPVSDLSALRRRLAVYKAGRRVI
jgi:imidazolonepropionase-like amidohydrolase